jgi:hypothetical protein
MAMATNVPIKLRASMFVAIYGQTALGMIIGTMKMGEYPGGLAEVIGLQPDPTGAPEIVLEVNHPTFGDCAKRPRCSNRS